MKSCLTLGKSTYFAYRLLGTLIEFVTARWNLLMKIVMTARKICLLIFMAYLTFGSAISFADNRSNSNMSHNQVSQRSFNNNGFWREYLWREPQDSYNAINNPDLYAWQLFVALNWPGNDKTCRADRKKALGDSGFTTWQMWRSREKTFLPNAEKPKNWFRGCAEGQFITAPVGDYSTVEDDEVRLNRATYHYIRQNKLYSLDQQERLVSEGVTDLKFPTGSKEIKANWVRITEDNKDRYHWIEVERDGVIDLYGLSALHISSKDQPNWFWSTFEHIDNEHYWPNIYPEAFRGWHEVPSVDRHACPEDNLACNKIPENMGLEGTKWQYFRLRGSQTDWVDKRGNPTVVTNSQIEGIFDQKTMSCLTCHALAVKGGSGPAMPIAPVTGTVNDQGFPHGYLGTPAPELFRDSNNDPIPYLGLDYVWVLRHAQREQ